MATASELKQTLVESGKYTNKDLVGVSKDELTQLISGLEVAENVLNGVESADDAFAKLGSNDVESVSEEPTPADIGWHEYVVSNFDKSELINGNPKVDGLRRVALKLNGPFDVFVQEVQAPDRNNNFRATAIVQIKFKDKISRTVTDAADVYAGNTDPKFAMHLVALAVTRAEARALRKALFLKGIAAEEAYTPSESQFEAAELISSSMLYSLNIMCDRIGVDLYKVAVKMGFNIASIEDLSKKAGLAISNELTTYQRKPEEIPTEVKK